jgi:hypothetical protein
MSAVHAFFLGLREAFTLSSDSQRTAALDEDARSRRSRHLRAARARRSSARKLVSPIAAIVLLRDALRFAIAASDLEEPIDVRAALATLAPRLPQVDVDRVVEHFAPASPFALDDLPFADAEAVRAAYEDCLARAIGALDTRSPTAIRVLRISRLVAVAVLLLSLVLPYVRTHYMLHDVALGKVVTSSPLRGESPPADRVVDGKTRGTFDIATVDTDHAFVMIDLGDVYAVDRVRVFNRGDGWFDDILPVVLDVSEDGVHFDMLVRRDEHFDIWTIPLGGRRVRFVRLMKPDRGYIALNEVEVFAR